MCGICGKFNFDRESAVSPTLVRSMADQIAHRGPDDEGYFVTGAIGLGFRRLSIIDLNTGHQPLSNEDDTVWIVFNGEIYNYRELRLDLETKGHVFKTQTDTEVIVHLYEEFGTDCVSKLRGMFAFAIWDGRRKSLFLARDRVGIKPLYYWLSKSSLVFGSEIKAILADPEVQPEVVPKMIDRFLTFYYVPGEETLLRDICKLAPGSWMLVADGKVTIRQYWNLQFSPVPRNLHDTTAELTALLDECVRMHMIADVPVGFLLSGGVDSTAMLGMAVGKTDHSLSSFTLGFTAPGLADERPYARLAAERFGSQHHEMSISAQEFADFLPHFAWYMEEPVCEPQAVALYYVTKLAAQHVKVLISGEGGDEAFAGYPIYRNLLWLERAKKVIHPVAAMLSSAIARVNESWPSHRLEKYGPLLTVPLDQYYYSRTSSPSRYFNACAHELYTAEFIASVDKAFSTEPITRYMRDGAASGTVNQMLYADTKTSLPDDLLLKADKMTMANSVELRVPFLDHKFLEFAAALPQDMKVRGFATKFVAKEALRNKVPSEILSRKKVGFPVPYDAWMRHELKDWVRDILLDRTTLNRGYFRKDGIEKLIRRDGEFHTNPKEILSLVALELWHRSFADGSRDPRPSSDPLPVSTAF
ncbi:MAG TPA: asparagine synthase (glutamine-hydrolyzing) [Terracidiphilus sp.]|nr:asparagine synthase (glutamine-hydrolyzing) [Terracidiphilus sp.]